MLCHFLNLLLLIIMHNNVTALAQRNADYSSEMKNFKLAYRQLIQKEADCTRLERFFPDSAYLLDRNHNEYNY